VNVDKLRELFKEQGLFVKETSKNIICICPLCGDHPNPRKRGHLYVSTDVETPVAHCFYCNSAMRISNLIKKITGSNNLANEVISPEEEKKAKYTSSRVKKAKERSRKYTIPEIKINEYPAKRLYIKRRSRNKLAPERIPNLIFDFKNFLYMNNLDIVGDGEGKLISNQEFNLITQTHVGFLSRHHTILFTRSCDDSSWMKFKKIPLQSDNFHLLDYWGMRGGSPNNNLVVLAEGNFDIIGEFVTNSLKLRDEARIFASGNSFSYSSLLKSVCFDENLYKCDVVILSDDDKKPEWYRKFRLNNSHVIQNLDIWANSAGKDFGQFPIRPFKYKDMNF